MRRRAEPVEAEPLGVARQAQRPEADQAGAEQRRRLEIRVAVGNREAEALVGDRVLRVAAVERVAGEARVVAEVLAPRPAVAARAAGPAQPRHADPLARREARRRPGRRRDRADDLVAQHQRQLRLGQLAVDDVQVGAADAAGAHLERDLPGPGLRLGELGFLQRQADAGEEHGAHLRRTLVAQGSAVGNPHEKGGLSPKATA